MVKGGYVVKRLLPEDLLVEEPVSLPQAILGRLMLLWGSEFPIWFLLLYRILILHHKITHQEFPAALEMMSYIIHG